MIISTLVSFFGGAAFRMIWGEFASWLNKKQDHDHEMARMEFQEKASAAQHERNLGAMQLQADLGVKTIQVQSEAAIDEIETDAWREVVKGTTKITGIRWVDAWNSMIRPAVATWAILMITGGEFELFTMSIFAAEVCAAALGIYLADRTLAKRNK